MTITLTTVQVRLMRSALERYRIAKMAEAKLAEHKALGRGTAEQRAEATRVKSQYTALLAVLAECEALLNES